MTAPWQPLLEWWFGNSESPNEVAAEKGRLWFGKHDSQDLEAQSRFGDWVEQALAGGLTAGRNARKVGWPWCCCSINCRE